MIDLAELKTRLYQDGADLPDTPIQLEAERAYREAFLAAAKEAGQWLEPDEPRLERGSRPSRLGRSQKDLKKTPLFPSLTGSIMFVSTL